jgi:hypothetical protein
MLTIDLDQDHRAHTHAVTTTSVLKCISTSGPDVFTRGIAHDHQTDLRPGESMLVEPGTLTTRIFSAQHGDARFSARLSLDAAAAQSATTV